MSTMIDKVRHQLTCVLLLFFIAQLIDVHYIVLINIAHCLRDTHEHWNNNR